MDLSDFVKSSLVEIIKGVAEAINETQGQNHRGVVNPALGHTSHSNAEPVNFDIAVTIEETGDVKAPGHIRVLGGRASADGKIATNTAVSRISFAVPVAWPSVATEQYRASSKPRRAKMDYDPYET
ncbi:MAG: hypothetical protein EPN97_01295 [Alphaproteobacteria bacterium]|nr:MAG: hypothetical protein EPN97_01295 [Alphaproteobacteria bacterium]